MARLGRSRGQQVADQQRRRQVLELRRCGASFDAISVALGYADASGAWRAYRAAMRQLVEEPAAELRQLELQRLDAMQMAIWPAVLQGKYQAIDRCLAIMDRRARLLGLDAPLRQIVAVITEEAVDQAIADLTQAVVELGPVPETFDDEP